MQGWCEHLPVYNLYLLRWTDATSLQRDPYGCLHCHCSHRTQMPSLHELALAEHASKAGACLGQTTQSCSMRSQSCQCAMPQRCCPYEQPRCLHRENASGMTYPAGTKQGAMTGCMPSFGGLVGVDSCRPAGGAEGPDCWVGALEGTGASCDCSVEKGEASIGGKPSAADACLEGCLCKEDLLLEGAVRSLAMDGREAFCSPACNRQRMLLSLQVLWTRAGNALTVCR